MVEAKKFEAGKIPANKCQEFDSSRAGFNTFSSSIMEVDGKVLETDICYWEVYGEPGCKKESKYDIKGTNGCLTNSGGRAVFEQKPGKSYQWVCYSIPAARVTLYGAIGCNAKDEIAAYPEIPNIPLNQCQNLAPIATPSPDPPSTKPRFESAKVTVEREIADGLYCSLKVYNGTDCATQTDGRQSGSCANAYYYFSDKEIYSGDSYKWVCKERHPYDEF
ncbi:hypothetical protein BKA63DRAFT_565271 [Paraphoma chrysanthemicola]|nr:hypothetical protein BKA63DRAFT_565271 [Paraphoma chrysanthemicola]